MTGEPLYAERYFQDSRNKMRSLAGSFASTGVHDHEIWARFSRDLQQHYCGSILKGLVG
jgi:hypothetical protein